MVRIGLAVWGLLSLTLRFTTTLGWVDAVFLPFLLIGMPVFSLAQLPLLERVVVERTAAYLSSAVAILTIGSIALFAGLRTFGAEAMGLVLPPVAETLAWTTALLAAAGLLIGAFWIGGRIFGYSESWILRQLLPQTAAEKGAFAMLSVAAGVGEELAFRAYAILALAVVLGSPWWALVVATTSFGLVHVYQGGVGLVRTYLLGLALGASYLVAGSLWPAIIAHTLVDVVGGLVLGERLVGPPRPPMPEG